MVIGVDFVSDVSLSEDSWYCDAEIEGEFAVEG
jgi:hypothetical protein